MSGKTSIWNKNFILLFAAAIVFYLNSLAAINLAPQYASFLGARETLVGLVSSIFALSALAFKFLSAPSMSAWNKKRILVICLLVISFSSFLAGISMSYPLLAISRIFHGLGVSFVPPCMLAVASEFLPEDKMASGIGIFSLALVFGQAFGPALGLKLLSLVGYSNTFFILCAGLAAAALICVFIKYEHVPLQPFKISLNSFFIKEALLPTIIGLFLAMAYFNIVSFLVLHTRSISVDAHISLFFIIYAIATLVLRPFANRFTEKFGIIKTILPSLLCYAIGFLILSLATDLTAFLVAAVFTALGYGIGYPAVLALGVKIVPPEKVSVSSCMIYIGQDVGSFIGPLTGGIIVETIGYSAMWVSMIITCLVAFSITLIFSIRQKSKKTV